MTLTRRDMLRGGAAALAGAYAPGAPAAPGAPLPYFAPHPFIEQNPKAVFVRRTHVPHKMDADAKRSEGLRLAQQIFVPSVRPGIPIGNRIVLKPNSTSLTPNRRTAEELYGTGIDPQFYEGLLMGLKQLGLTRFTFIDSTSYALVESARPARYQRAARHHHAGPRAPPPAPARGLGGHLERSAGRRGVQAHSPLRARERARHLAF